MLALAGGAFAVACNKEKPKSDPAAVVSSPAAAPAPTASVNITVGAARDLENSCIGICQHSRALKCAHADECMKNCIAMAAGTPCMGEFTAFYGCLSKEPAEHWECAEDGIAAIREGYCEKEQERVAACMDAKSARP